MDPIVTILFTSSTVTLSTLLKEKHSETRVEKVGEKFLAKIKSKKFEQLKIDEFKELILEVIQETNEYPHEEALQISDKVVIEVLAELQKYQNDIKTLGKRIDEKFSDILENMDRSLARQFLELKNDLNRFVYLAKDQTQKILQFLREFQDDQIIDRSFHFTNFIEQCLTICNEYGNYVQSTKEARNFVYTKLSYDFFQLMDHDEIVIEKKGIKINMNGKRLTDEFKFIQFFTSQEDPQVTVYWTQIPKIFTDPFSVQTMIEVNKNFVNLLESFQDENKRFQFLHEFMNIFYRLTERSSGSMVALSSVMDYENRHDDLSGFEFENAIIGFLYLLKMRNVELPAPFHYKLKSFEIKENLMERLESGNKMDM